MSSAVLKCIICPKKPKFSDTSHLLTHVSSKGHLSHYFKLQVKSHQEPEAGDLLSAYDEWYKDNNLAGLLSDRMLIKEAKKGRNHDRSSLLSTLPTKNPKQNSSTRSATLVAPQPKSSIPDYLDPRLCQPYQSSNTCDINQRAPRVTNSVPEVVTSTSTSLHTQRWPKAEQASSWFQPQNANGWKVESQSSVSEEDMSPLVRRRRPWNGPSRTSDLSLGRKYRPISPDPFVDDTTSDYAMYDQDCDYEDDEEEEGREMTKLKGILWPGMDIFDSATEEMRKKRNQKKDGTILKQMEKTSESVEPTEMVFSPSGTLRKERLISGMVDDSSPLKGETPIPKRRVTRPRRPPLARSNPNTLNMAMHVRKNAQDYSRRQTVSLEDLSRQTLPFLESSPANHHNSLPCFDTRYLSGDSDFNMTYADMGQKIRRGFAVFNDGNDHRSSTSRGRGAMPNVSTTGNSRKPYHGPFEGPPASLKFQPRASSRGKGSKGKFRSSGLPSVGDTTLPVGKENIEPLLHSNGRVDTQGESMGWIDEYPIAAHEQHPSQLYYGANSRPGLGGTFGGADSFGYSSNPLSYSISPSALARDCLSAKAPEGQPISGNARVKLEREVSPDGTVSDFDGDDFERMYLNNFAE